MTRVDIKQQFESDGYYLAKGVYSISEISAQVQSFEGIVSQLQDSGEDINARWQGGAASQIGHQDDIVLHTHNVHRYSRVWLDSMLNKKFLEVASAILGDDIVLHHSKLFQKPAEQGAPFPVHQDWSYFPTEQDTMIAGVIHVSDATDEMGCFRVFPGSHRLGRLLRSNGKSDDSALADYPLERATIVEADAGDVLFFHYLTLHGSFPNRSSSTRKTVLVQMYAGYDQVERNNLHVDEQLVLLGTNSRDSRLSAGVRR